MLLVIQATICLVMTMLPSPIPAQVDDVSLITVCVSNLLDIASVKDVIFPKFAGQTSPIVEVVTAESHLMPTLLFVEASAASAELIQASDGFLMVIDGGIGLSPNEMTAWHHAADHTIPRTVLAFNVHSSRADFDEVVAIVERVLEPDAMVRYLPIENDDENHFAGIYDVLTGDIHDYSSGELAIRHGDPEHMSLTADKREALFDELAHHGLDDDNLKAHTLGMPLNIPSLERIWKSPDIVSVIPVDDGVGNDVLLDWVKAIAPRWLPTIILGDDTCSVNETRVRVGLCIADGFIRMWGQPDTESLEIRTTSGIQPLVLEYESTGLIIAPGALIGDVVKPLNRNLDLLAPNF